MNISQDLLINVVSKYLDFFDVMNLRTCNKKLEKEINYRIYENNYFEINVLVFKCIIEQKIYGLEYLNKIYDINKILRNRYNYLSHSIDEKNIDMFLYLGNNYFDDIFENNKQIKLLISKCIKKGNLNLTKYLLENRKEKIENIISKEELLGYALYSGDLELCKYIHNYSEEKLILQENSAIIKHIFPKNDNSDVLKFFYEKYFIELNLGTKTIKHILFNLISG